MKCFESLPHNEDDWPDPDKCGECPYDVDPEYDEPDEPTPEEMQDLIDEEAELEYGEEEYY